MVLKFKSIGMRIYDEDQVGILLSLFIGTCEHLIDTMLYDKMLTTDEEEEEEIKKREALINP